MTRNAPRLPGASLPDPNPIIAAARAFTNVLVLTKDDKGWLIQSPEAISALARLVDAVTSEEVTA